MRLWGMLALLAAGEAVAAEAKLKVAMLALRAEAGVGQGTVNLLGEVIAADAATSPKHQVMTATDVAAVLSVDRQRQLLGCKEDVSCMAEIGSALGADLLLDVSIGAVGSMRVVALRLIDARQGAALRRESESVTDESQLVDACHRLTAKLFDLPLPGAKRARVVPGVILLGGAGALTVGGILAGTFARNDVAAYRNDPFNEALADRARTKAYLADGLYGGALVTAAVAAFLLFTGLTAPSSGSGGY